jgi:penicillin-binding protein 1B
VTQQLVKGLGFSPGRSWSEKFRKGLLAIALECRYTKADILEAYLNTTYLGHAGPTAVYGMGAAARTYFDKDVQEIDLAEAATLAAMIRAPNVESPLRNPERLRARRDLLLRRMRDLGRIDETAFQHATNQPVHASASVPPVRVGPYFFDHIYQQIETLHARSGVRQGGLRVYTSLDPVLQAAAEAAVARTLDNLETRFGSLRRPDPARRLQGLLVALDPATGEIRALVGGRDYGLSQFNRVTHAHRQPGSTFKPFVFLAALRAGRSGAPLLTATSHLDNHRVTVQVGDERWTPRTGGMGFLRTVTVRRALELSLNGATVRAAEMVGVNAIVQTARDVGFTSPIAPDLKLALGAFEVTPLELAAAYAPFANLGARVDAHAVRAIVDGGGAIVGSKRPGPRSVVRAEEAFVVTHLLRGVVDRGTAAMARPLGVEGPAAGKTGSTNRDGWFVGYTPRLVVATWVGFDESDPLPLSGAWAALPIWADFMRTAMAVVPGGPFVPPPSVVFRDIDMATGKLATPFCPIVYREAFLPSTAPTEPCSEHGPRLVASHLVEGEAQ